MVINLPLTLGLKKGDKGIDAQLVNEYLVRFGYIIPFSKMAQREAHEAPKITAISDEFNDDTVNGLELFQKTNHLPVTGKFDKYTMALLQTPRCGVSDYAVKTFYFLAVRGWSTRTLTYKFENYTPDLSSYDIKSAISRAFDLWSSVIPVSFKQLQGGDKSDITIKWVAGYHEDGYSNTFDGPNGVLAHAFYPEDGRMHFDEDEVWVVNKDSQIGWDLFSVALHEIGHLIGLDHSDKVESIMYAYMPTGIKFSGLYQDDISGAQYLYGSRFS